MFFVIVCVLDIRAIKIFPDFVRGGGDEFTLFSSFVQQKRYIRRRSCLGLRHAFWEARARMTEKGHFGGKMDSRSIWI
jgi:hypothetical protein